LLALNGLLNVLWQVIEQNIKLKFYFFKIIFLRVKINLTFFIFFTLFWRNEFVESQLIRGHFSHLPDFIYPFFRNTLGGLQPWHASCNKLERNDMRINSSLPGIRNMLRDSGIKINNMS